MGCRPAYAGSIPALGSTSRSIQMSEKSVQETFEALFALTELRQVFRETKPTHKLNEEQKAKVKKIIEDVRRSLSIIEEDLIK